MVASIGWCCNHFSALRFQNRNDISSAIGCVCFTSLPKISSVDCGCICSAFSVGFIGNIYGKFFSGNAFVIMVRLNNFNYHP